MKILFTGGGTAGHIMPIVAVSREIRKIFPGKELKFYYLGPKDNFASIFLSQENIKIKHILAGKIRRYLTPLSLLQNVLDICFKIPLGILQSFFLIFFLAPDLTFSKGGYGALPATFSSWLLQIPVFLHESDIAPGAANIFLSRFAKEIFISFSVKQVEGFPLNKMIMTGNPIRNEILSGSFDEAREFFGLTGEKPVVLIMGGSQGAQRINDMILEILPSLLNEFEIIHQCGEKNFNLVNQEAKVMISKETEKYYHLIPFMRENELRCAYAASLIATSRAGANSISEIAAKGLPSILIPLKESAQNHQQKNAYAYAQEGACLVIEEENLTPHFFLEKLKFLAYRPQELERMRNAALSFSQPNAARIIAGYLLGNSKNI
jgi:UDP-N-acetylglucosamine--N-acetylmuramyl-(pentapeptide) pyrophosphoryl-undecaprenol N-acetylglucosamine transferase